MKQCLLAVVGLIAGIFGFVTLLASAGAAIQESPRETVLSFSSAEKSAQGMAEGFLFPFSIPDTTLTARSLALYEGEMLEVDTGEHIVGGAALEVENSGDREVAVVYIVLTFFGEQYHFYGTNLPPGSTSLLIEMDGRPFTAEPCSDCAAWVRYGGDTSLVKMLSVTEVDGDTLRIKNISEQTAEDVILYYKNYCPEGSLYLGGVTYQTYIGTLMPGQEIEISPFRYVAGYSKIVKAVPH